MEIVELYRAVGSVVRILANHISQYLLYSIGDQSYLLIIK